MSGGMNVLMRLRMARVVWILASSGAHRVAHQLGAPASLVRVMAILSFTKDDRHQGEALGRALERMGAGFIKLGQLLATRSDIVGEAVARSLSFLHDDLKPLSPARAKKQLEEVLGGALTEHFRTCDVRAVKAASIAQIHKATTHDGKTVAIKLLRPNVMRQFMKDFKLLRVLVSWIEKHRPDLRQLRLHQVLDHLEVTVRNELDLRLEASAMAIIGERLRQSRHHRVPRVYWQWNHEKLLVMEWIDATRMDEVTLSKKERTAIVTHLTRAVFGQIFRDGFFHADIHPGNILLDSQKRMVWLDFGITGALDEEERLLLAMMMDAFFQHDYERVARLHKQAGYVSMMESTKSFAIAMERIAVPVLHKPLKEVSMAHWIAQILNITENFAMEAQPQLLMLQKTLFLLESLARMLNDDMDLWTLGHGEVTSWLKEQSPSGRVQKRVQEALPMVSQLPRQWQRVNHWWEEVERDGLRLHPDTVKELRPEPSRFVPVVWWLVGLVCGGVGVWLWIDF